MTHLPYPGEKLKAAPGLPPAQHAEIADTVQIMLARLKVGREETALDYAARLDGHEGSVDVAPSDLERAGSEIAPELKDAIDYAHKNIRRFAEAQRASIQEFSVKLHPGLNAGQRLIPVRAAGCYVPGGRYAHIASALMTITTAHVAGVPHVAAVTPPRDGVIAPAVAYAMHRAGADRVLMLGGVQGIAALSEGLFGLPPSDVIAGPGNAYVAEAKRQLFGPVGIDMFAGPTDSMILADNTADAWTVAVDLIGQAEHGTNSPVWLATTSRSLADAVIASIPNAIAELPEDNATAARMAWDALGEVILCNSHEELAQVADAYGPEHLHVQAKNLPWWRDRLTSYGSLFLGAGTTVSFGDKAAGPNHVLPTSGAARYTGGLSVHKFLKCVTWQSADGANRAKLARASAAISRAEGMEGHALSADLRAIPTAVKST
ncbi:MAG: histidinol dehydrogenase [Marinovum sp.]|nr:histidinol dehydrogenase [Marinovum sp.]